MDLVIPLSDKLFLNYANFVTYIVPCLTKLRFQKFDAKLKIVCTEIYFFKIFLVLNIIKSNYKL